MCDKNVGDNEIEKGKKIPVVMISEAASTQYRENLLKDIEVAFEGNNDVSQFSIKLVLIYEQHIPASQVINIKNIRTGC